MSTQRAGGDSKPKERKRSKQKRLRLKKEREDASVSNDDVIDAPEAAGDGMMAQRQTMNAPNESTETRPTGNRLRGLCWENCTRLSSNAKFS
jgi:hypothetical protein